jgi:hypothetical protein
MLCNLCNSKGLMFAVMRQTSSIDFHNVMLCNVTHFVRSALEMFVINHIQESQKNMYSTGVDMN